MPEYGCVSVWLKSDPRIHSDGDTFEEAVDNLFETIEFKRQMWGITDQLKQIKGTESWFNNPVQIL